MVKRSDLFILVLCFAGYTGAVPIWFFWMVLIVRFAWAMIMLSAWVDMERKALERKDSKS